MTCHTVCCCVSLTCNKSLHEAHRCCVAPLLTFIWTAFLFCWKSLFYLAKFNSFVNDFPSLTYKTSLFKNEYDIPVCRLKIKMNTNSKMYNFENISFCRAFQQMSGWIIQCSALPPQLVSCIFYYPAVYNKKLMENILSFQMQRNKSCLVTATTRDWRSVPLTIVSTAPMCW